MTGPRKMLRSSMSEEGGGGLRDAVLTAQSLVEKLGGEARSLVAFRAGALSEAGDDRGARFWNRVARAVELLANGQAAGRTARRSFGERVIPLLDSQFRQLFDVLPHAYLLLDPDLVIGGANPAYLAVTMTTRSALVGAQFFEAFPPGGPEAASSAVALRGSFQRALLAPDRIRGLRYDIRDPEGAFRARWWDVVNCPAPDRQGRPMLIVHHVKDVTPSRRSDPGVAGPSDLGISTPR